MSVRFFKTDHSKKKSQHIDTPSDGRKNVMKHVLVSPTVLNITSDYHNWVSDTDMDFVSVRFFLWHWQWHFAALALSLHIQAGSKTPAKRHFAIRIPCTKFGCSKKIHKSDPLPGQGLAQVVVAMWWIAVVNRNTVRHRSTAPGWWVDFTPPVKNRLPSFQTHPPLAFERGFWCFSLAA